MGEYSMQHLTDHLTNMELIHLKLARKILKAGAVVTLLCWDKKGEIQRYEKVIVTSVRYHPDMINVMIQASREVRQIRTKLIYMINDLEVCL